MATCDVCGDDLDMPYECHRCGGTFCSEHRLPEHHDCPGLNQYSGAAGTGRFDSDVGNTDRSRQPQAQTVETSTLDGFGGPGGLTSYVRRNMTFVFLAAMWVTFGLQLVLRAVAPQLETTLFVLQGQNLQYVWTWITSIFAHGDLAHIAFNSIVLYFFGPLVERRIGSRNFTVLFLGAGMLAGLTQELVVLFGGGISPGVVGASGAILSLLGVLTILNPNLRVLLFFFIPMPLWVLTIGFAAFSVLVGVGGGAAAGNIAHFAHLAGLLIGLIYGRWLKQKGVSVPDQLQFGGGGPGGPGRRRW